MIPTPTEGESSRAESLAGEIAVQAELLALNFALEGRGAEEACEALYALSHELKQAGALVRVPRGPRPAEP